MLAIDLGTSGPKVAIVDSHGDVLGHEFEDTPLHLHPGGGAEQDPDDWWNAVMTAGKRLLERDLCPRNAVRAICCTAQWSGTVAVDGDGKHLLPAISWMDSRGAPQVEKLVDGALKVEGYAVGKLLHMIRKTGGAPGHSGKDPLAHILWIKEEHPEVYAKTAKFLEPKDYLNYKLTGQFKASYDSIALHWVTDNRKIDAIDYDEKLLALTGLDREKLPDLAQAVDVLAPVHPQVADAWGLSDDVQVVMGTPDVHSAAVGSGAVKDFECHVYIGTSSWMTCHVPFKKTDPFINMASLPSAIPGRYLVLNEQETAGQCLNFLRDNLLFPDDALRTEAPPENFYPLLDEIAATVRPGCDKLMFLPWLYGERTPVEDHMVRGGFFNMSLSSTRAHMIRAVLEGVALNSRWLMEALEKFIKRPVEDLRMIGGGARSDLWCQIYADVLNRPIKQVANPIQANARGAAMLALSALGVCEVEAIGDRVKVKRVFEPNPNNRGIYDELFDTFVTIYKQNKKTWARLNRR